MDGAAQRHVLFSYGWVRRIRVARPSGGVGECEVVLQRATFMGSLTEVARRPLYCITSASRRVTGNTETISRS